MEHQELERNFPATNPPVSSRIETIGRVLFLVGGGVLLSVLVSCACGPTR